MQNVQNYAQCAKLPKLQNMFLTLCDSWSNAEVGQRKCQNLSWQHNIKVVVIIVVPLKALSIKIIATILPCWEKLFVAVAKVPFPHQMSWIPTCLRQKSLIIIIISISISINAHQYWNNKISASDLEHLWENLELGWKPGRLESLYRSSLPAWTFWLLMQNTIMLMLIIGYVFKMLMLTWPSHGPSIPASEQRSSWGRTLWMDVMSLQDHPLPGSSMIHHHHHDHEGECSDLFWKSYFA